MSRFSGKVGRLTVVALAMLWGSLAQAAWPNDQPITIIVPQAPGGTNDTLARLIAPEMAKLLGQAVVVENKPGGASSVGMQATARAKPDGYTLAIASDSAALSEVLRPGLPWKFLRDLQGVGMIGEQPISISVSAKTPYDSFQSLVAAAKAAPGTLGYATSGVGSSQNIVGEWTATLVGIKLIHIPYKGGGQARKDVIGGQTPIAVLGLAPMLKAQQSGGVRILAITTPERSPMLPDVPTLTELGYPQIAVAQWAGVVAPEDTPQDIVARLSDTLITVLEQPAVRQKIQAAGITPKAMGYKQFDAFLVNTIQTWQKLVPELGIKVQ